MFKMKFTKGSIYLYTSSSSDTITMVYGKFGFNNFKVLESTFSWLSADDLLDLDLDEIRSRTVRLPKREFTKEMWTTYV